MAKSFASSLAFVVGFGQIAEGTARAGHWELVPLFINFDF